MRIYGGLYCMRCHKVVVGGTLTGGKTLCRRCASESSRPAPAQQPNAARVRPSKN